MGPNECLLQQQTSVAVLIITVLYVTLDETLTALMSTSLKA